MSSNNQESPFIKSTYRVKMYKRGTQWVVAGITAFSLAGLLSIASTNTADAATESTDSPVATVSGTESRDASQVKLRSDQTTSTAQSNTQQADAAVITPAKTTAPASNSTASANPVETQTLYEPTNEELTAAEQKASQTYQQTGIPQTINAIADTAPVTQLPDETTNVELSLTATKDNQPINLQSEMQVDFRNPNISGTEVNQQVKTVNDLFKYFDKYNVQDELRPWRSGDDSSINSYQYVGTLGTLAQDIARANDSNFVSDNAIIPELKGYSIDEQALQNEVDQPVQYQFDDATQTYRVTFNIPLVKNDSTITIKYVYTANAQEYAQQNPTYTLPPLPADKVLSGLKGNFVRTDFTDATLYASRQVSAQLAWAEGIFNGGNQVITVPLDINNAVNFPDSNDGEIEAKTQVNDSSTLNDVYRDAYGSSNDLFNLDASGVPVYPGKTTYRDIVQFPVFIPVGLSPIALAENKDKGVWGKIMSIESNGQLAPQSKTDIPQYLQVIVELNDYKAGRITANKFAMDYANLGANLDYSGVTGADQQIFHDFFKKYFNVDNTRQLNDLMAQEMINTYHQQPGAAIVSGSTLQNYFPGTEGMTIDYQKLQQNLDQPIQFINLTKQADGTYSADGVKPLVIPFTNIDSDVTIHYAIANGSSLPAGETLPADQTVKGYLGEPDVTVDVPAIQGLTPDQNSVQLKFDGTIGKQKITVTYYGPLSLTVKFVDNDNQGATVGTPQKLTGTINTSVDWSAGTIPAGYQLAPGQVTSGQYSFTGSTNPEIDIHLVHKITPNGGVSDGGHSSNQTGQSTNNVPTPNTSEQSQEPSQAVVTTQPSQAAAVNGTATSKTANTTLTESTPQETRASGTSKNQQQKVTRVANSTNSVVGNSANAKPVSVANSATTETTSSKNQLPQTDENTQATRNLSFLGIVMTSLLGLLGITKKRRHN